MDYFNKYLKYKSKYLSLKNNLSLPDIIDKYENYGFTSLNSNDINNFKNNASTYGRLTHTGFKQILDKIKEIDNTINFKELNFLDMGSGDGYVVAIASFYFKNSYGVELSEKRHKKALELFSKIPNVKFTNDDMLNYNLENIDIIYISSCCFPQDILLKIGNKIKNDKHNIKYIATTKEINLEKMKYSLSVKQSWSNDSNIFLYKLI